MPRTKKTVAPEETFVKTEPEYISIFLQPTTIRSDAREFRQNSVEYGDATDPRVLVKIKIPNKIELVSILEDGSIVLTPSGMFYLQKQLEQPYLETAKKEKTESAPPDDWDEEEKEPENKSPNKEEKSDDDDWGDDDKLENEKSTGDEPADDDDWS